MVYAANGGFTLDGIAYGASFQYRRARPRGPRLHGVVRAPTASRCASPSRSTRARATSCSSATRSSPAPASAATPRSHDELREIFGREVVTLSLVDPSFYHLDTAIAVLDDLEHRLPAEGLRRGVARRTSTRASPMRSTSTTRTPPCSASTRFSDGHNVVIASRAADFERQLRERGYNPHRRRPLRAAARRRRSEVLHAGAAAMTTHGRPPTSLDRRTYLEQVEEFGAHNYHPLAVVVADGAARGSRMSRAAATWTASPRTRR